MMAETSVLETSQNPPSGDMPVDRVALMRLANDGSDASRRRLLGVMRDIQGAGGVLSDRERALVADILKKLVRDFEAEVRRRLVAMLERGGGEPMSARLQMAIRHGEADLARRLLSNSPLLNDADLIEVVHHRAQQHRLATALRRPAGIGDSSVDGDGAGPNGDVMETLLNSDDKLVASGAVDYLVEEAKRVDRFQEPVLRREELSHSLAERVTLLVSAALRQHLLETYDGDPAPLDDVLETIIREGSASVPAADPPTAAQRLAKRLGDARLLSPELIVRVLRQGEVALFEAFLAERAMLPAVRIRRILEEPSGRALAMLCRGLGLSRAVFSSIYLLRTQQGDARIRDPAALTEALAFFDGIPPKDAQDLLRLWRRDPAYVDAVEQLRSL